MDNVLASLGNTSDAIFIRTMIKMAQDFQLHQLHRHLWKFVGLIILRIYMEFASSLWRNVFKFTSQRCYRTLELNQENHELPYFLAREIGYRVTEQIKDSDQLQANINGINVYLKTGSKIATFRYLPWIHSEFLRQMNQIATKNFQQFQKSRTTQTICKKPYKQTFVPKRLFMSKNIEKISHIVLRDLEVSQLTQSNETIGILLDGKPGLGKTGTIHYLAQTEKFEVALHIDFTEYMDDPWDELLGIPDTKLSMVIMLDELDKYVNHRIKMEYQNLKIDKNMTRPSFTEFSISFREKFVYAILGLLQRSFSGKVVFILCSNNFETIFEGLDMRHFKSFMSRLLQVHFELSDKSEIIKYMEFHNEMFQNSELYCDNLSDLFPEIPEDLQLPIRVIHNQMILSQYQFKKFVESLSQIEVISSETPYEENHDIDDADKDQGTTEINQDNEDSECNADPDIADENSDWEIEENTVMRDSQQAFHHCNPAMNTVLNNSIAISWTIKVRDILNKISQMKTPEEKIPAITQLFEMIIYDSIGMDVVKGHDRLRNIILNKVREFNQDMKLHGIQDPAYQEISCALEKLLYQ